MRRLYVLLVRLHPRPFRERFGGEMLAIFDEKAGARESLTLLADGAASLLRQRLLRAQAAAGPEEVSAAPDAGGVPVFHTLDDSLPRRTALVHGGLVSLLLFGALAFAIGHSRSKLSRLVFGSGQFRPAIFSIEYGAPKQSVPSEFPAHGVGAAAAAEAWRAIISSYFDAVPVLRALDSDADLTISAAEVARAPVVLALLDVNRDGQLSPEECGHHSGGLTPGILRRHGFTFMRVQPVTASLDADRNGIISRREIRAGAAALARLDFNGDGNLAPVEVMPDRAAAAAAGQFLRLDADGDDHISRREAAGERDPARRAILRSADRNQDGTITRDELTREIRLRTAKELVLWMALQETRRPSR
ncbi:MAG: hypothetical protein ACRD44_16205 [Bryobacteraceae bacterium]